MNTRLMYFVFILFFLACNNDHRAWNSVDTWSNPPPENIETTYWSKLPDSLVHIVLSYKMEKVDTLLNQVSFIELDKSEASFLTGCELKMSAENRPYLIRAVYLGNPESGYSIQTSNDSIIVLHGSIGHRAVPMKRYGLIVLLNKRPSIVFNMCYRSE